MWRARLAVLLGASCCALVACSSPPRSTVSSLSGVSGLPCDGDRHSGQVVAAYRAMLAGPNHPDANAATHLYVSTTLTTMDGIETSAVMSAAVQRCMSAGVAGLPPITLVHGGDDPSIPTVAPSADGAIRNFVGNVVFVSFGDVVVVGSKATSSVSVDKGGGDFGGAEYVLKIGDRGVTAVSTGAVWIS
jgi:hypothetical protein